jgi:hypothetical protein
LQDPPKFTQIWVFGLKTNRLATLIPNQWQLAETHKELVLLKGKSFRMFWRYSGSAI